METIVVRRLAEAEVAVAKGWYELQCEGLGDRFVSEFHRSAIAIAEGPLRWPRYHGEVRRYVMHRFPYIIFFDIRPEKIRILRVVHASQDPLAVKDLLP